MNKTKNDFFFNESAFNRDLQEYQAGEQLIQAALNELSKLKLGVEINNSDELQEFIVDPVRYAKGKLEESISETRILGIVVSKRKIVDQLMELPSFEKLEELVQACEQFRYLPQRLKVTKNKVSISEEAIKTLKEVHSLSSQNHEEDVILEHYNQLVESASKLNQAALQYLGEPLFSTVSKSRIADLISVDTSHKVSGRGLFWETEKRKFQERRNK